MISLMFENFNLYTINIVPFFKSSSDSLLQFSSTSDSFPSKHLTASAGTCHSRNYLEEGMNVKTDSTAATFPDTTLAEHCNAVTHTSNSMN